MSWLTQPHGMFLGSWRWPVAALIAFVAALLSAFAESWVSAIAFGAVAVVLFLVPRIARRRA